MEPVACFPLRTWRRTRFISTVTVFAILMATSPGGRSLSKHTYTSYIQLFIHTQTQANSYTCISTPEQTPAHTHIHATHTHMHERTHERTHARTHARARTHTHAHARTHAHTHTVFAHVAIFGTFKKTRLFVCDNLSTKHRRTGVLGLLCAADFVLHRACVITMLTIDRAIQSLHIRLRVLIMSYMSY